MMPQLLNDEQYNYKSAMTPQLLNDEQYKTSRQWRRNCLMMSSIIQVGDDATTAQWRAV
jgi:hypothetical protein